ncbi:hypothetical protein HU200_058913 [Digitaria exilis]|uniref:Uncharacterized protein n=1 Tax=Digitaria exilis TaxID=1010633 RepID=A0A835DYG6_9POAL|nr:hypothetical protein HU200_058913 [Digitaria exilis]
MRTWRCRWSPPLPRLRLSNRYSASNGCHDLVERVTRILVCGRATREVLGSSSNPRTLALELACCSKHDDGLGLKDLVVLNKSLMIKHVHKLFSDNVGVDQRRGDHLWHDIWFEGSVLRDVLLALYSHCLDTNVMVPNVMAASRLAADNLQRRLFSIAASRVRLARQHRLLPATRLDNRWMPGCHLNAIKAEDFYDALRDPVGGPPLADINWDRFASKRPRTRELLHRRDIVTAAEHACCRAHVLASMQGAIAEVAHKNKLDRASREEGGCYVGSNNGHDPINFHRRTRGSLASYVRRPQETHHTPPSSVYSSRTRRHGIASPIPSHPDRVKQTKPSLKTLTAPIHPLLAMAPILLGPPAIRAARPSTTTYTDDTPASHPFLDLLDAGFNTAAAAAAKAPPRKTLTETDSGTFANSGNTCLDFFFHVVPNTPSSRVRELVAAAWARNPLTTLKLVANLRGVRGTGKSDREGFYAAALWLHDLHPRTLACNVPAFAEFGYLKDFPELLYRLIHGADVRAVAKARADAEKSQLASRRRRIAEVYADGDALSNAGRIESKRSRKAAAVVPVVETMTMEVDDQKGTAATTPSSPPQEEVEAAAAKKKKKITTKKARKVAKLAVQSLETYYGDRAYRFLFNSVADFFAELLASDLKQLAPGGNKRKIGLAAKWCPTPGSSFDRSTLLCEAIARRLFPRDADMSEEHYSYHALHRLRREVLVPLRKVLELPEVYMSAQRWSELPYTRVASVAMRRYKSLFKKHDEERFGKYLEDVEAGKAKIAAGALLPHEIAAAAYRGEDDDVSELQWRRMVGDLRSKGSLSNCIAVCDVSGSMHGTPMEVCVALGLLISELSEEPWAGKVITFSERPEIHLIKGETLAEKLSFVREMQWGLNTALQLVFDRILTTAVDARLAKEKMIRTVFVFSDMEFDEASTSPWETDYEVICRKFQDAGYGDVVPQMVFWNLRDSHSTPVTSTQPGVAMVSGFAKNFVKLFLNDGVVNPEAVMEAAIAGEEYQKLAVPASFLLSAQPDSSSSLPLLVTDRWAPLVIFKLLVRAAPPSLACRARQGPLLGLYSAASSLPRTASQNPSFRALSRRLPLLAGVEPSVASNPPFPRLTVNKSWPGSFFSVSPHSSALSCAHDLVVDLVRCRTFDHKPLKRVSLCLLFLLDQPRREIEYPSPAPPSPALPNPDLTLTARSKSNGPERTRVESTQRAPKSP